MTTVKRLAALLVLSTSFGCALESAAGSEPGTPPEPSDLTPIRGLADGLVPSGEGAIPHGTSRPIDSYDYPVADWEPGVTLCSAREYEVEGKVLQTFETYAFEKLTRRLRGTEEELRALADEAGLDTVDSCESARAFAKLDQKAKELEEPELPAYEDSPVEPRSEAQADAQVPKILEGTTSGLPKSTVEVELWKGTNFSTWGYCSGTLINGSAVIFAAHCIPGDNLRPARIWVMSGGTKTCIHGCNDCTSPNTPGKPCPNLNTYQDPDYAGAPGGDNDENDDFGIGVRSNTWGSPANSSTFWGRMMADLWQDGLEVRLAGWGVSTHSGMNGQTARKTSGDLEIDWHNSWHFRFVTHSSIGRGCSGDSGGPAILMDGAGTSLDLIGGVYSEFTPEGMDDECPYPGDIMRYCSTPTKIPWIEEKIGVSCITFSAASGDYVRCW